MAYRIPFITLAATSLITAGAALSQTTVGSAGFNGVVVAPGATGAAAGTVPSGGFGTPSSTLGSPSAGLPPLGASSVNFTATGGALGAAGTAAAPGTVGTGFSGTLGNTALGSTVVGATGTNTGATGPNIGTGAIDTANRPTQEVLTAQGVAQQGTAAEFFSLRVLRQPGTVAPAGTDPGNGGSGTLEVAGERFGMTGITMAFTGTASGTASRITAQLNGAAVGTAGPAVVGNLTGVIGSRTAPGRATIPFFDGVARFNNGSNWRLLGRAVTQPRLTNTNAAAADAVNGTLRTGTNAGTTAAAGTGAAGGAADDSTEP